MDKGLIRFAKFAGGVLAVFVVVGVYLFGFDIKEAVEKTSEANIAVQTALLEIENQRQALGEKLVIIDEQVKNIEEIEAAITADKEVTQSSVEEVKQLLVDIRQKKDEAFVMVVEMRQLGTAESHAALAKKQELGIGADRGKLWENGSSVRFRFLDGEERVKAIVRTAIAQWTAHANLTFIETDSAEAEVRISFKEPGSWSFIGTDALGIPSDSPTLNYGSLTSLADPGAAMQNALHEFGHTLGLAHEFQSPFAGEIFNRQAVISFYSGEPYNWDETTISRNVFDKVEYPGNREYDPFSIMNYAFPKDLFVPGRETQPGIELSESDKEYIRSLYPPD
jgi:hypothetical protein